MRYKKSQKKLVYTNEIKKNIATQLKNSTLPH